MLVKTLQANVNRSKPSLDLLVHQAKEMDIELLLVSEPNFIPDTDNWFMSDDRNAAIFVELSNVGMRLGLREFNNLLDELSALLSYQVNKIILGGDFNAKADLWGSRTTDGRGRLLIKWAAERDLRIMNIGNTPTCVRPQGSSIVDITWASPDLTQLIRDWMLPHKWNTKRFDKDFFTAVMIWRGTGPGMEDLDDVGKMTAWLDQVMEEACDAAASRIGPRKPRHYAYWWQDPSLAWQELLDSIDRDPWGLPYKIVLKKLKVASPGMTEILDPDTLGKLLNSLFPRNVEEDPIRDWSDFIWSEEWSILLGEVHRVVKKVSSSSTKVPGLDGFRLTMWKGVTEEILK
ncbi:uncharacterized protein [Polyergus mexicanus]|uniref:uncharacterized protein n=1 Tax=Polyergus mexicanus TaxID=615972 RepID=UPI0038B5CBDF